MANNKKVKNTTIKKAEPVEKKVVKNKTANKTIEAKKTIVEKVEKEEKKVNHTRNTGKIGPLWLIGLICPIVGIILYFVWKKDNKTKSSNILTGTIIGAGLWLFIGLSLMINTNADPKKPVAVDEETQFKSVDWYNDTLSDTVVTVIGSSTCPHCQEYKPVINELSSKYGFKLYFVEADKISEEDYAVLSGSYDLLNNEGYVPYTFIVKKGKFVADTTGFADESTTIQFLKDNKIIK